MLLVAVLALVALLPLVVLQEQVVPTRLGQQHEQVLLELLQAQLWLACVEAQEAAVALQMLQV